MEIEETKKLKGITILVVLITIGSVLNLLNTGSAWCYV
jgi:hypothetical protein